MTTFFYAACLFFRFYFRVFFFTSTPEASDSKNPGGRTQKKNIYIKKKDEKKNDEKKKTKKKKDEKKRNRKQKKKERKEMEINPKRKQPYIWWTRFDVKLICHLEWLVICMRHQPSYPFLCILLLIFCGCVSSPVEGNGKYFDLQCITKTPIYIIYIYRYIHKKKFLQCCLMGKF